MLIPSPPQAASATCPTMLNADLPAFLRDRLSRSLHVWEYWRHASQGIVEIGTVRGRDVGLPTHFHAEDQITFVLAGRRRFHIGSERIEVEAGHGVRIPAGTPHRSLGEDAEVICINIYADPASESAHGFLADLARACGCRMPVPARQSPAATDRPGILPVARADMELLRRAPVRQAAARMGLSREGFSRKIRQAHAISPQDVGLMARLNVARRLLQEGYPLAGAAADAGFSDQSHLGRCFRRAFGVTPGRYRAG